MNNSKKFKVIGIMSGTSMDGIDFAYLETNGINYTKNYIGQSYKYPIYYKTKVRAFIKKIQSNSNLSLKTKSCTMLINFLPTSLFPATTRPLIIACFSQILARDLKY